MITIKVDAHDTKLLLKGLPDAVKRVRFRAVNKTVVGVRTDESAEVRSAYNLSKKYVDKSIYVQKATYASLSGRVDAKGSPIGLINFTGTKQVLKGVSVKVKTNASRTVIKHAFIATAKTTQNVFQRKWKSGTKKPDPQVKYGRLPKVYRLPISRKTGPRVTDHLGKSTVFAKIQAMASARYLKNVDSEMNFEISKL